MEVTENERGKRYSRVGREYVQQSEIIKNMLTMGVYSVVADAKYAKQYTAEERLARLN